MATMSATSAGQDVARRLMDDGYVVVTGMLTPPGAQAARADLDRVLRTTRTGGANQTTRPRLGVILEYAAGWLRQQENHCLAVPRDIARELPERLQELLGYNIYPPFVGYVDGSHPRGVLSAGSGTHRQSGNPKLVAPPSSTSGCALT